MFSKTFLYPVYKIANLVSGLNLIEFIYFKFTVGLFNRYDTIVERLHYVIYLTDLRNEFALFKWHVPVFMKLTENSVIVFPVCTY